VHQFNHNPQRGSIVVDVPSDGVFRYALASALLDNAPVKMYVGVAKLHPKDRFSRAAGRLEAEKRIKETLFNVEAIVSVDISVLSVYLIDTFGQRFAFRLKEGHQPWFIGAL